MLSGKATLKELQTHYDLDDILDFHLALDTELEIQDRMAEEMRKETQTK